MTRAKHLTEEALMLLTGKRLSLENELAVRQHLEECAYCKERHANLKVAHAVFERLSEAGLNATSRTVLQSRKKHFWAEYAFPWGPITAIILGSVCVLAVFFYPKTVPEASASELLADAIQNEGKPAISSTFRIQVGGSVCSIGTSIERTVSSEQSDACIRALRRMKESRWAHGNPLSARTFRTWHDSLRDRHDRVLTDSTGWQIQTTTHDSPAQAATLQLRSTDYHPTKLTLQFEGEEELTISEDAHPVLSTPVVNIAKVSSLPEVRDIDEQGQFLEVKAWELLHAAKADTGWEATVVRDGNNVTVKAEVDGDERRQELLQAFAKHPEIRLDVHSPSEPGADAAIMPQRAFVVAGGLPLAENWLKEKFPDSYNRMAYANSTLQLSQQVLGRVFIVEKLKQRRTTMTHCSCVKDLSNLLAIEESALSTKQDDLALALKPLIGSPEHSPSRPLSLPQATDLDLAIQELVGQSSSNSSSTFDSRLNDLQHLL